MDNIDFENLALEMSGILEKDESNFPIYSGDVLISLNNNFHHKNQFISKFKNYQNFIENVIFNNDTLDFEKNELYEYIKEDLLIPLNSSEDRFLKICVAEYFRVPFFNKNNLFLHGSNKSFNIEQFNKNWKFNYQHLQNKEIEKENYGYCDLYSFNKHGEQILIDINKFLKSKFGKKIKIIGKFQHYYFFKFKIKNHIAYKKAEKIRKGILYRNNWYKNLFGKFPYIHFYINKKIDLLEKHKNTYNKDEINDLIDTLYKELHKCKNKHFSIFCTRFNDINDKSKIYFWNQ